MYFSKDADAVPTFEFPGSTGAGSMDEEIKNILRTRLFQMDFRTH